MEVTFYGVRGSTPCSSEGTRRYGGNTACVVLRSPGADPLVLDLGTGLRSFGLDHPLGTPLRAHALVSHLHWDHVQGLPFCAPVLLPGSELTIHGPADGERTFADAFDHLMAPPFFPVRACEISSTLRFVTMAPGVHHIGGARVTAASVPHTGDTLGFRIERDGVSVAYVSDHQQPVEDPAHVDPAVLELCAGVDLLIHDAQYTPEEFVLRSRWGHCTVDYAVHVAVEAGARSLALFHHDPAHDDDHVDDLERAAAAAAARRGGPHVFAAAEGLRVPVRPAAVRA